MTGTAPHARHVARHRMPVRDRDGRRLASAIVNRQLARAVGTQPCREIGAMVRKTSRLNGKVAAAGWISAAQLLPCRQFRARSALLQGGLGRQIEINADSDFVRPISKDASDHDEGLWPAGEFVFEEVAGLREGGIGFVMEGGVLRSRHDCASALGVVQGDVDGHANPVVVG